MIFKREVKVRFAIEHKNGTMYQNQRRLQGFAEAPKPFVNVTGTVIESGSSTVLV